MLLSIRRGGDPGPKSRLDLGFGARVGDRRGRQRLALQRLPSFVGPGAGLGRAILAAVEVGEVELPLLGVREDQVSLDELAVNIFGQQAGTVPNFHYSPELVAAGENGLVWTEETIMQYIAGPDQMVPGTKMIISSGPVTDPALQRAVINALKRDAMRDPEE